MKTIVATHNPDLARDFDRDLLRRRDLRLVTARSGQEAIERARQGCDLLFLDRVLPDGEAELVVARLREDSTLSSLPVVLVNGIGFQSRLTPSEARARGFADAVELPSPPGVLPLLVARLLGMPLREDERFAVRVAVFDAGPNAADGYLGTSLDLSENGMLLRAKREVPVGSEIPLRFSLPGRAGELQTQARVVRVDTRSFAPAKALALSFLDLGDREKEALSEYLGVLVGGRPFTWRVSEENGGKVISFSGVLRADSDLSALASLTGEVTFRLREFRRISSDSVQRWIDFVRSLAGTKRIRLVECPISFIHQANLIPNLLDRQEVGSFFAPYACHSCGLEEERLIEVARHLAAGAQETRRTPPYFACSACGAPLVFDDLVDQYFSFLR
jgi:CheY-like chemotaxis protein